MNGFLMGKRKHAKTCIGFVCTCPPLEPECEHADTDEYECLNCGKELTESRMAAAYDRAKDARKYGA